MTGDFCLIILLLSGSFLYGSTSGSKVIFLVSVVFSNVGALSASICFASLASFKESCTAYQCFIASGIRSAFAILSTSARRGVEMLSFKYLSIISEAIGAAHVAPKPAFSTTTAIAILGFSLGANATKSEWFLP